MLIIDSHLHIYPKLSYLLKENSPHLPSIVNLIIPKLEKLEDKLAPNLEKLELILAPIINYMHTKQAATNNNSNSFLLLKDKLLSIGSSTSILANTNISLQKHMLKSNVDYAFALAHPPIMTNDFILELANKNTNVFSVVNIQKGTNRIEKTLRLATERGAIAVKIHAAMDGVEPLDEHHFEVVEAASKVKKPVIIHTGCLEISPLYKEPRYGHAEKFEALFGNFPNTNFILAHMNMHFPETAIALANKYKNVFVETSWQPEDNIHLAIKKLGPHKVIYGSDWPILGNNIEINLARIHSLFKQQKISLKEYENVLGLNAKTIFNLKV